MLRLASLLHVSRCYTNFSYSTVDWRMNRHMVAKFERHPGELQQRAGLVATYL
jgi:hypothetical protein